MNALPNTHVGTSDPLLHKIDIIWNMTLVCPWDCGECCVDAIHVSRRNGNVVMRSEGLSITESLPYDSSFVSPFEQAVCLRQQRGLELDLAGKRKVLANLAGHAVKLDFSGGDAMVATENFKVMCEASNLLGRQDITLTATGAGLAKYDVAEIAPVIGELNYTYDNVTPEGTGTRPAGYANGNLRKASLFAAAGVKTRAECPLSSRNISEDTLRRIFLDVHEAGAEKLLLMRLFPVGRGTLLASDIPTPQQYRAAIAFLRDMESKYRYPQIKLQCALKFFDNQDLVQNPCDLVRESYGLMADGTLLSSPWAIGHTGKPLHDVWVLGNLATTRLRDILTTPKVGEYLARSDENFGHCKIFSFLNSRLERSLDRVFDTRDPLYS